MNYSMIPLGRILKGKKELMTRKISTLQRVKRVLENYTKMITERSLLRIVKILMLLLEELIS